VKKFLAILSLVSLSSNAAYSIKNAEMNYTAAQANYNNMAYHLGWGGAIAATPAMNEAGAIRAQAYADANLSSHINVAASTLAKNMPVTTSSGVVMAGLLPPNTQVAVPYNSVFTKTVRGGNNQHNGRSYSDHGTGNGGNNAANSNSAHGLGGGNHIGGGAAQSGSRGHW